MEKVRNMAYSVIDISKYVVCYSNKKNYGITNLRLQKILYFIQAYFLKIKKEPCFKEDMEAWDFGPVVPCVYQKYKKFGAGQIPDYTEPVDCFLNDYSGKKIVDGVIDLLSSYQTFDLVDITHHQSPWLESYESARSNIISIEAMKRFVKQQNGQS